MQATHNFDQPRTGTPLSGDGATHEPLLPAYREASGGTPASPRPEEAPRPRDRRTSTLPYKTPRADLRAQYAIFTELGLAAALAVLVGLLRAPIYDAGDFEVTIAEQEIVQMEEIQQTKQEVQPPPPPRPPVPVEVPNETVLEQEELQLDATLDIDEPIAELPPPPPPPPTAEEEAEVWEEEIFVVVEQMPELIGGLAGIQARIRYPDIAKKAGIEGRVIVQFIVDEEGNVRDPVVVVGIGGGCDEEAVRAIREAKFTPGRQRGKAVPVKMAVPVLFRLN